MITVVLTGYKRSHNFWEQYYAIKTQTVEVSEIMMWINADDTGEDKFTNLPLDVKYIKSSTNLGVWNRFYYAGFAQNEYVCVFDDDTVPGHNWLKNCLDNMTIQEGLYGTVGLRYHNPLPPDLCSYYNDHTRYGWPSSKLTQDTVKVDFVGHSWFFKRDWIRYMMMDLPDIVDHKFCGEDMHFSYMLQKYAGIDTFVPPHPTNDMSMWGSLKGYKYGADEVSLSYGKSDIARLKKFESTMNARFINQRKSGWRLTEE